MPRVFISYRRSDSSTISGRIYDHLARVFAETNVFKDVYDIPAGSDFRKVIEDNINACHAQLIVIGPNWIDTKAVDGSRRLDDADDAVRIEVETGLNCKDILVIPVLVSGASMPSPEQLPESMRNLSFRNAIVIRDDPDFRGDIGNLLHVLRQLDLRQNTSRWRRRIPYIGVLAVVALVLVIGVLVAIANNSGTRFDLIMSNGTETRIFSLALTSPVTNRATPTAASATPRLTAGVSATPEASATPGQSGAASATPSPAGAAATDIFPPTANEAGAIILIRQGDALQDQGDYPAALDRYTQAIALDPNNSEGYISRASVYATLGTNFDQAIEDAKT
ncbi:MAG: TIR domain-containing protein, partial [Chloroflexota bacterium]